jgi:hypothetical protein
MIAVEALLPAFEPGLVAVSAASTKNEFPALIQAMRRRRETRQKVLRLKSTSADGSGMAIRAMSLPPVKVPVFDPAREQAAEIDRAADVDLVVFNPGERAIRVAGQKEIVGSCGRR